MLLKPDYPTLSALVGVLGACLALPALAGVVRPAWVGVLWNRFPRAKIPGYVLSVVTMVWTALWIPIMLQEFIPGRAASLFPFVQIFVPVAIAALIFVLPELLSCRTAGLLFVLLPAPLLSAAQWHPSVWRLVVVVSAYVFAVAGMFIVARPWYLRDAILFCNRTASRTRAFSLGVFVWGLVLFVLSLVEY